MESLAQLQQEIEGFYERRRALPIKLNVTQQEVRELIETFDFIAPQDLTQLTATVSGLLSRGTEHATHPRYFGLFLPTTDLAGVIADALAALYNPQLGSWDFSPVASEMEHRVLQITANRLDFQAAAAHFTSGGSEANHTAVSVALTHHFPDMARLGLRGLQDHPTLYLSEEAHHSFEKIAHQTGLGRDAVRRVAAKDSLQLDMDRLAAAIQRDRAAGERPFLVVATAGTTNAGVVDPLPELAGFCRREGLWLHVDGAWGAAAAFSDRLKPLLAGVGEADSLTLDPHKWLSVPMGAGVFLCRHRQAVDQTFGIDTAYVPEEDGDSRTYLYRTSMQWSRRFIGLKMFMVLAHKGLAGVAQRIDRQTELGDMLREKLNAADAGWVILNQTPLPVVCFTHPNLAGNANGYTRVATNLANEQIAWVSKTMLRGRVPCLRACITNYLSTENDLDQLVEGLNEQVSRLVRC